jgi:hypothetical protein
MLSVIMLNVVTPSAHLIWQFKVHLHRRRESCNLAHQCDLNRFSISLKAGLHYGNNHSWQVRSCQG